VDLAYHVLNRRVGRLELFENREKRLPTPLIRFSGITQRA
jgi:hypothetical protein